MPTLSLHEAYGPGAPVPKLKPRTLSLSEIYPTRQAEARVPSARPPSAEPSSLPPVAVPEVQAPARRPAPAPVPGEPYAAQLARESQARFQRQAPGPALPPSALRPDAGTPAALGKGAVHGLTETVLSPAQSLSIGRAAHNRKVTEQFDRIDRGEDIGPIQSWEVSAYRMAPAERRAEMRQQFAETDPTKMAPFQAAEAGIEAVHEAVPATPEEQERTSYKLGSGVGSTAGFLVGGAAGRVLKLPAVVTVAGSGAAVNAASQFKDAIGHGASIEDATSAAELGAFVGTSEAAPISRMLDRFDHGTGGTIRRTITEALKGGTEEALQEAFQSISDNLIASDLVAYDPERGTFEGTGEAAGIGFTIGGLFNFLASAMGGRRRAVTPPEVEPGAAETMGTPRTGPEAPGPDAGVQPEWAREFDAIFGQQGAEPEDVTFPPPPEPPIEPGEQSTVEVEPGHGMIPVPARKPPPLVSSPDFPGPAAGQAPSPAAAPTPPGITAGQTEPQQEIIPPGQLSQAEKDQLAAAHGVKPMGSAQRLKREQVDQAAAQAATPTEAQAEAGNYKKGHVRVAGLDIAIETPKGQTRGGYETKLPAHYGYVKGTEGRDGDHVDVFIGDNPDSDQVYIVDQIDQETGEFDEHKAILGADTPGQALALYRGSYDDQAEGRVGGFTALTMAQFEAWLAQDGRRRKAVSELVRLPAPKPVKPRMQAGRLAAAQAPGAGQATTIPAGVLYPETPGVAPGAPEAVSGPSTISLAEVYRPAVESGQTIQPEEAPKPEQAPLVAEPSVSEPVRTAEEGRPEPVVPTGGEAEPTGKPSPQLTIEPYSDNALVIRGNTREHKETIKAAGIAARWNPRAQGWVIPRKQEAKARERLADLLGAPSPTANAAKPGQLGGGEKAARPEPAGSTGATPAPAPASAALADVPGTPDWNEKHLPKGYRLYFNTTAGRYEMSGPGGYLTTFGGNQTELTPELASRATETARKRIERPEPEPAAKPKGWTEIGRNAIGQTLYEDERGVRSYIENGVRHTEPVGIRPGGGISVRLDDDRYKLASEIEPSEPEPEPEIPAPRIKTRVGIKQVNQPNDLWSMTLDGEVMPNARKVKRHEALAAAREWVDADPDYRALDPELAKPEATLAERLASGEKITPFKAREIVMGKPVETGTMEAKEAEERIEAELVKAARMIVREETDPAVAFDRLMTMYRNQPTLSTRTSGSMLRQAYSTPIPLGYAASRLAGASRSTTDLLEPTAGNGALLIERDKRNTIVNELDKERAANLRRQGFTVETEDATAGGFPEVDVILANPPFGAVRDEEGRKSWDITGRDDETLYATGEIDHQIAWQALKSLTDDGDAVLLLAGPHQMTMGNPEERRKPYLSGAKQKFYYALYNHYNVVDHFTVNGKMYERQGAGWPIDVIVIRGRLAKDQFSERALPARELPRVVESWDQIKELAVNGRPARERPGVVPAAGEPARGGGAVPEGPVSAAEPVEPVPPSAGRPGAVDVGEQRPERPEPGERPVRAARPEQGAAPGVPGAGQPGAERPLERPTERPRGEVPGQPPRTVGAPAGAPGRGPAGVGVQPRRERAPTGETSLQKAYVPTSRAEAVGTLTPANLVTPTSRALAAVASTEGGIDQYVAAEMGWTVEEMNDRLSAEQIDSLALAISKLSKGGGFVIGDQTGVGKGRVNAAIIRWAKRTGRIPVFLTEKPNLYADMVRDLTDIGEQVTPLITNAGLKIPLPDETYLATPGSGHETELGRQARSVDNTGKLDGYDAIFTTYSQAQTIKGKVKGRHTLLSSIMPKAVLILDESHNAGGTEKPDTGRNAKNESIDRATMVRNWVQAAQAVFYSSATYAKRPGVMSLYSKTSLGKSMGDQAATEEAFQNGGIPLQQVVASMLADAGEYVRRERSFDGVEFEAGDVKVNHQYAEQAAEAMREIVDFQENYLTPKLEDIQDDIAGEGTAGQTAELSVSSTNFTAIMHNVIDQMLLSAKAPATVERAKKALADGEKPVIAVANTMESILKEIVEQGGVQIGQRIEFGFNHLLARYLERTRWITQGSGYGKKERVYLTDEMIGPEATRIYNAIRDEIMKMDFGAMPGSPIDYIRSELEKAGHSTGELTGRGYTIDYAEGSKLRSRPASETSKGGVVKTIAAFNSGELDVLVINQSGATGLSLHSSEKFKDQRRRRMIIAQPEKNIDTFMQILGRVHRTGQVVPPAYTLGVADIPAEQRPAAVLTKKLKSLNANTTASAESTLEFDLPDFMDEIGDKVVRQILRDNPEIDQRLGRPLGRGDEDGDEAKKKKREEGPKSPGEAIRKMTGRIPLLPVKQQAEVYQALVDAYTDEVERMRAMGENVGAAETMELDAKFIERTPVASGGGEGPFGQPAYMAKVDVKRMGKAMTREDALEEIGKHLPGVEPAQLVQAGRARVQEIYDQANAEFTSYVTERTAEMDEEGAGKERARLKAQGQRVRDMLSTLTLGQPIYMRGVEQNFYGLVTNVRHAKGHGSPFAPNRWKVDIAVADPMRKLTVSGSNWDSTGLQFERLHSMENALRAFDMAAKLPAREERYIIIGNVPAGFSAMGARGKVMFFTDQDGQVRSGVLMPRNFKAQKEIFDRPVTLDAGQALEFVNRSGEKVTSTDSEISVKSDGRLVTIKTPASKAKGGRVFLDPGMLKAMKGEEFVKVSGSMQADIFLSDAAPVLKRLVEIVGPLEANTEKELALEIAKQKPPEIQKADESGRFPDDPAPEPEGIPDDEDPFRGAGTVEFHAGLPFGKLWDWFLEPFFRKHWGTMGKLPGGKKRYMQPRRRAQGRIDEMDRIAGQMYRDLDAQDQATKDQIYQYLTDPHASVSSITKPEARRLAYATKRLIDMVGREMVHRGALSAAQYAKYKDRYLPRLYLKFLFETEGVSLGPSGRPVVSKAMMGRLKKRKDIPTWERDILLGEIKDPAYLSARAFGEAARSIAIWDFLETISRHPEWIYPNSVLVWRGKRVTVRWLEAEAARLASMKHLYPEAMRPAVQNMIDDMQLTAQGAIPDPPDPRLYKQVPDSKRYGYMRGLWVRKEIYDDIVNSVTPRYADDQIEAVMRTARRGVSLWKGFKTAWSLPAQVRNAMSGYVQAHLFGRVPFVRMPERLLETIYDMATNGPAWQELKRHGVKSTSFAQAELLQIHNEFKIRMGMKHYKNRPFRLVAEILGRINDKVGDVYSMNEQLWKTLVILHHTRKGMSAADAADLAHEAVFDYSDVPNVVRALRSMPFGAPFVTFMYKALPATLEAAARRPWAFFPYAGLVYGAWALLQAVWDLDDEEAESLWKVVPEWMEHGLVLFLPTKDEHGRWQPIDLSYILPFGGWWNFAAALYQGKPGDALGATGLLSHPALTMYAALSKNSDHFGREVYTEGAPPQQKIMEAMGYVLDQLLPLRTFTLSYQIAKAFEGVPNRFGEPGLTPGQAGGRLGGVNIYPYDARDARELKLYLMDRDIGEAESVLSRIERDQSMSREERKKRADKQEAHIDQLVAQQRKFQKETRAAPR